MGGWVVGWWVVGWLVGGWLVGGWLVGWWVWLVGWLVGWLVDGWLVGGSLVGSSNPQMMVGLVVWGFEPLVFVAVCGKLAIKLKNPINAYSKRFLTCQKGWRKGVARSVAENCGLVLAGKKGWQKFPLPPFGRQKGVAEISATPFWPAKRGGRNFRYPF